MTIVRTKSWKTKKKQAFVVDLKNLIGHRSKNKNVWQMIVQYVLTKCFSFHFSSVFLSLSSDFLCMYAHTFLRVQGEEVGARFSKSQPPPPKFGILLHFFVTISNFFPILTPPWGSPRAQGGGWPPCPPFMHICVCMHFLPIIWVFQTGKQQWKKNFFH